MPMSYARQLGFQIQSPWKTMYEEKFFWKNAYAAEHVELWQLSDILRLVLYQRKGFSMKIITGDKNGLNETK